MGVILVILILAETSAVARIVRPMKKDPSDPAKPCVGSQSKCLGVRTTGDHADVAIDGSGNVIIDAAEKAGMSVTRCWTTLIEMGQPHLVPQELDDDNNGARGRGMAVFVHGTGAFEEAEVTNDLRMWFKKGTTVAGVVAPAVSVPIDQYQADLAATLSGWVIDPRKAT